MEAPTKVAIVNAGRNMTLSAARGDYDEWVKFMQGLFEREQREGKPLMDPKIVQSTEEALAHVGHEGVVIYVTMGMSREAETVKRDHPYIRVVVLSGEWREKVIYLSKARIDPEVLARIVVG